MIHVSSISRRFLVLTSAALTLCIVGCAPAGGDPAETPSSAATPTDAAKQDEETETSPVPIKLPECDTANPLAAQEGKEFFESIDLDVSDQTGPTDREVFTRLAGPVAQKAMNDTAEPKACHWPLYIAGHSVTQYSTTIAEETREPLLESLRESDFVETALGSATVFTHSVDDPTNYRMNGSTTIQYLFVDGVWIAIFETGESDYSQSALDSLVALNPQMN